jgi:hypothetical protein
MKYVKKPIAIDAIQIPEWLHTKNKSLTEYEEIFGASIIRVPVNQTKEQYMEGAKAGRLFVWIGGSRQPFNKAEEEPSYEVLGATVISLEGVHDTKPTDWIITGVSGERYFCRNDIFVKSYDPLV